MDDVLARMKQQLQNFTHEPSSVSGLNRLQETISETKVQSMQVFLQNISDAEEFAKRKISKLLLHLYHMILLTSSVLQIAVGGYSSAVKHLDPKVEQLEADMDAVGDDFSRLIDEVPGVNFPQLIKLKLHQEFGRIILFDFSIVLDTAGGIFINRLHHIPQKVEGSLVFKVLKKIINGSENTILNLFTSKT